MKATIIRGNPHWCEDCQEDHALEIETAQRLRKQIAAVRALADGLDAPTNWDRRSNQQLAKALRAVLDGGAS